MAEPLEDPAGHVPHTPRKGGIGRLLLDTAAQSVLGLSGFTLSFLWWLIKWTFAVVFFVAIMALTGFYVFNRATAAGNHVTVPNITNIPLAQAVLELEARGLDLGEPERVSSDKPEFMVIAQRPTAGAVVRAGRKVYPTISARDPLVVPDVIRKKDGEPMTLEEADLLAKSFGFQVSASPARVPHPQPRGTIIAQDPPAGGQAGASNVISVLVSDGAGTEAFLMPDLVGRRVDEVPRLLETLGVKGEMNSVEAEEDQPYGVVLAQAPPAGTWIQEGMKIIYQVRAQAPEEVTPTQFTRRFTYQVPFSWSDRRVRLEFVDYRGMAEPVEQVIRGGDPARLSMDMTYQDEVTVHVYIDGKRTRTYYYKGNNEPVIQER